MIAANSTPWMGVVFWAEDENNAYDATISPSQRMFAIYRYQNAKTLIPVSPRKNGSILDGPSVNNEISVAVNGQNAILAVNGNKAIEFRGYPPARGSRIGFTFGTFKSDPEPVTFILKRLEVRELERLAGSNAVGLASSANAVDRMSLPGPIEFDGEVYRLSWSSHPRPNYYKQEYLPVGQTSEHFERMVLVDAMIHGIDVNGAVAAQVNMLKERKATDPVVNFALFRSQDNREVILDFVLSAHGPKGEEVVEWNAYRYAPLKGKAGQSGVLLFGISRRAYGNDVADFLRELMSVRAAESKTLARYPLPVLTSNALQ
jgi:hypothetical protein